MKSVISKDGTSIAYDLSGSGPALILVGGALQTRADHLMGKLVPFLAKDFTVTSYDRRGRGSSGNTEPYAVDREIEDLEALVHVAGGSAYVFGNSSGGMLALLAATRLRGITKLAAYEAPFIPEQQPGRAAEDMAALKAAVGSHNYGKAVRLFLKRVGVPGPVVAVLGLSPAWSGMKALAPTLVNDAIIAGDGSVPASLAAIAIPTLLITGSSDAMKGAAEAAGRVVTGARHEEIAGQTHDVKPELLAAVLVRFFRH